MKAIVAWDNLSVPRAGTNNMSFPPGEAGCPAHPGDRTDAKIAKPALGITADYFIPPEPNTQEPDPYGCQNQREGTNGNNNGCKVAESLEYSKAGVDTGAIVIRGGSHYEFSFLPDAAFGATLRGADLAAWYTSAWFDKYVKGDCTADARLLTNRWRHDEQESAIDPNGDGNMFSFYYPSRLDVHLANGQRYDDEHLRTDAHGLGSSDGFAGDYSYASIDRSPDDATTSFGSCDRAPVTRGPAPRCATVSKLRFPLHHARRTRIVKVQVFVDAKRRLTRRGRNLRSVTVGHLPRRAFRLKIVSTQSNGKKRTLRRSYRACPRR